MSAPRCPVCGRLENGRYARAAGTIIGFSASAIVTLVVLLLLVRLLLWAIRGVTG